DLAVRPLQTTNIRTMTPDNFLTDKIIERYGIGVGDEVFMIGRFVNHEGRQKNTPTVRFGNLAMMPHEKILDEETGLKQESFLIETRSIPGCSGAPVFIWVAPYYGVRTRIPPHRYDPRERWPVIGKSELMGPWLLG